MKLILFAFFLLSLLSNLQSQVGDSIVSDSIVKVNALDEVEVRAMYSNISTRRFPATVYAINASSLDILLPININESLNKVPSIYAHAGTFNTSRITMRGIGTRSLYGTRKINALLNDIPLTSGEGDTFIDDIDLQFIDRVEVVGGPTAGIYGPALGGSLLMFTKPAQNNQSVNVNFGAGSFNTFQGFVSANFVKGKSAISFMYKNIHSDGYRENNNYNRNSAIINYNHNGKHSIWNIMLLFTDVNSEIPSSIDSSLFANNPRVAAANWAKTRGRENTLRMLTGISHQYIFSPQFSSYLTVYGLYKNSTEVRPFNFLHEDDRSGGVKLYVKKKFQNVEGLTLTPGISIYSEKYKPSLYENIEGVGQKGTKTAENIENIFQANAYLILDYVPNRKSFISLSANANTFNLTDKNVFTLSAKQKYEKSVSFSPRLSVSHLVLPTHYLFFSVSHGLSYPSMQEILLPDGTLNNNVQPEKAWSFETGLKCIQLFNELKYSLALYYMPVNDLIVPERIAEDTYIGKNIGKSIHKGMELSLEKAVPVFDSEAWFHVADYRFTFNWQSNKFQDFFLENINLKGNQLPGVPEKRLFLSANLRLKNFFFVEPELFVNGKTPMNDQNTLFYKAYRVANLRFGIMAEREKWNWRISSSINNVFDEKYASMILINAPAVNNRPPRYYYPGLPRNFNLSLSVAFQI